MTESRRQRAWRTVVAALLWSAAASTAGAAPHGMAVMVPAYFYPEADGDWSRLSLAATRVPVVAIANVFNGPGTAPAPEANYTRAINDVRAAGGRVIGYVYTRYGERPLTTVKADMTRWHSLYAIDGFFVDEMDNTQRPDRLAYYGELYRHAKSLAPRYHLTGNPGTRTEEIHLTTPTADTLCVFESPDGYPSAVPAPWTAQYAASRFLHLAYAVPDAATMELYLDLAHTRSAGYVYLTDDTGGNPWDRLPGYWEQELARLEAINTAAAAAQPPVFSKISLEGNLLHLEVQATAGRYQLDRSGDLHSWQTVASVVCFGEPLSIDWAVEPPPATTQYYRVRH